MSAVSICLRPNSNLIFGRKHCLKNSFRCTTNSSSAAAEYCVDLVRKFDYENFLCTLLLTSQLRSLAFAVRAFNIEVSRVQDQVSQVQIGQMRLKFWLDTIEKLFKNEVREHPVAIELYRTIKDKKLSKNHLKNLVNSRMIPISSTSFKTIEDMEKYAESSVSPVFYLISQGSGLGSIHVDHAASHLGKSQGITNLLRSIPYNTRSRIVPLPQDLLLKHNLSQEKILRKKGDAELKEIVFEIASRAKQHLDKARNLRTNCPKESSLLFLPAVCIDSYLERLRKVDFDIFHETLQRRNNLIQLQLYWNKLLKRY